jgi:hypothetical protein
VIGLGELFISNDVTSEKISRRRRARHGGWKWKIDGWKWKIDLLRINL